MDRVRPARQSQLFVKPQVHWLSQADGHTLALKVGLDDSGFGLESEIPMRAGALFHKPRKTTRPIAAHLPRPTVAIVKLPRPVRFAGGGWNQDNDAIRA